MSSALTPSACANAEKARNENTKSNLFTVFILLFHLYEILIKLKAHPMGLILSIAPVCVDRKFSFGMVDISFSDVVIALVDLKCSYNKSVMPPFYMVHQ